MTLGGTVGSGQLLAENLISRWIMKNLSMLKGERVYHHDTDRQDFWVQSFVKKFETFDQMSFDIKSK